ncbi:hypothetical protein [Rhizobium sp. LCM 4573]|uniref:hypothetical protein n=1 Tax=Rhizobium sp. LCM 4573 TaxID=1848291 RepID=UPI0008DA0034|nr:hypothetical protein [Rhizobium sp. LCM 4573]OHV76067.1 hypothetical protein LCM4573_15630 [Rhizobium sp. LCM 4573]
MKIDSGLNGYHYPNRTPETERKAEEAPQRETATFQRSPDALTGSSTLLSSSLANALWSMEMSGAATRAEELAAPAVSQDWVEELYQEFA